MYYGYLSLQVALGGGAAADVIIVAMHEESAWQSSSAGAFGCSRTIIHMHPHTCKACSWLLMLAPANPRPIYVCLLCFCCS